MKCDKCSDTVSAHEVVIRYKTSEGSSVEHLKVVCPKCDPKFSQILPGSYRYDVQRYGCKPPAEYIEHLKQCYPKKWSEEAERKCEEILKAFP